MKTLRMYTHVLPGLLVFLKEVGEILKERRVTLKVFYVDDGILPYWLGQRGDYTLAIEPCFHSRGYSIEVSLSRREEGHDCRRMSIVMTRARWHLETENLHRTFEEVRDDFPPGYFGVDTEDVVNNLWALQQPLADLCNSLSHIPRHDTLTACKMVIDSYPKRRPRRRQPRKSNKPLAAPTVV